ncbi:glycoside hydrolase family 32 protein [Isoptericola sp. 178]|uniref:glycoside hydrolase family 32 protein n=1 Tax=Isoptericola sp. 178 TaxID=3064651 RepID=UPI0027141CDC|nr:glycoside hydrolase family 32 protein [Isoptericola sp. 178]MDO8143791.1 glycoside hydrolase family 32 protein [Isoptericola sp. 178]
MSTDGTRPLLHFTPRTGWINDPLGLTFHDDRYHLFFQHVPDRTTWSPAQHWGHATSADGLRWEELDVVLSPGDGEDGVWSGTVVPTTDGATLLYTAVDVPDVQVGRVRSARPTDDTWTAWTKGPVVATVPDEVEVIAYRDPYVFHDGDHWRMLMGVGFTDGTAAALVHTSDDLESWVYDGVLAARHGDETDPEWTGTVWECPQLFPVGDRWVLVVSVWEPEVPHHVAYAIGDYADGRFHAESWHRLSYGPAYYAASAFVDADGGRGLIHWLRGIDDPHDRWASAHSLPHRLSLAAGRLVAAPPPAVDALRAETVEADGTANLAVAPLPTLCDVEWTAVAGSTLRLTAPDGSEGATLTASPTTLEVRTADGEWSVPLVDPGVRVVLDGPVLEVFTTAGVLAAHTPWHRDGSALEVRGATARVHRLDSARA